MSLRVVDDLNQAIDHMERYGSHHSDAIVTGDAEAAESSSVAWSRRRFIGTLRLGSLMAASRLWRRDRHQPG